MRNKAFKGIVSCLAAAVTFVSVLPFEANSQEYTVGEVQSLIDGIVDYKINSVGAGSVQDWLNGDIADNAGTLSEWYAISLSQDGYSDLSAYESALSAYLSEHNEPSPTSREKYALALSAAGSRNSYISDILDTSVGEPAPEAVKPAEKKKSPDKDDMIGLIYEKYGCAGTTSEFASLIDSVTELVPDNEKLRIRQAIEQTVNAEAEAAFHAGFEAAKELLK